MSHDLAVRVLQHAFPLLAHIRSGRGRLVVGRALEMEATGKLLPFILVQMIIHDGFM